MYVCMDGWMNIGHVDWNLYIAAAKNFPIHTVISVYCNKPRPPVWKNNAGQRKEIPTTIPSIHLLSLLTAIKVGPPPPRKSNISAQIYGTSFDHYKVEYAMLFHCSSNLVRVSLRKLESLS